jgi:hypothetical protein
MLLSKEEKLRILNLHESYRNWNGSLRQRPHLLLEQKFLYQLYDKVVDLFNPITITSTGCSSDDLNNNSSMNTLYSTLLNENKIKQGDDVILIRGSKQKLYISDNGSTTTTFKVSTAAKGFGNEKGSEQTPTGLMQVTNSVRASDKFEVLIGQQETNDILGPYEKSKRAGHCAEVLTGLLNLKGVEECNKNVSQRSIYIHGTNREQVLGKPASGGCIRVSNNDVITLVNKIKRGTYVYITPV